MSVGGEMARAPAGLLDQADVGDLHLAVDRLAHVVDGQRRHRNGGHRLHLDAGAPGHLAARRDLDAGRGVLGGQFHLDRIEAERMAQRDQIGGTLGASPAVLSGLMLAREIYDDPFPNSVS